VIALKFQDCLKSK